MKGLGLPVVDKTDGGLPQADVHVIKKLAGSNPAKEKYGIAYDHFVALGDEEEGIRISKALHAWIKFKSIETLLQTYILPLQTLPDKNGRIHCSLNFNTETGRLSSRKPNL